MLIIAFLRSFIKTKVKAVHFKTGPKYTLLYLLPIYKWVLIKWKVYMGPTMVGCQDYNVIYYGWTSISPRQRSDIVYSLDH